MPPRTTSRSANLEQASSPPKALSSSPPRRVTRATRSQSRDLDELIAPSRQTRQKRNARESSVDSAASDGSMMRGGRGKKTRGTAAKQAELSRVVEVDETEELAEDQDVEALAEAQISPGAMSNLSGTTALSHSQQELVELDWAMVVEILPDLYTTTKKLLSFVAPADASMEVMRQISNEIKIPGSRKSMRLERLEGQFEINRKFYGSDLFINVPFILRKLFDGQVSEEDTCRPDLLLQQANIATLIKTLLIANLDHPDTLSKLLLVDDLIPTPFLSGFDEESRYGRSALRAQTFEFGLEIRTQIAIGAFKGLDPDSLLVQTFWKPAHPDSSKISFDNLISNGVPRAIGNIEYSEMTRPQKNALSERIDLIRKVKKAHEDIEDGDCVDFEMLEKQFPWPEFLAHVVRWSRAQLAEISHIIEEQGGIDSIMSSLINKFEARGSQISLEYEAPEPAPRPAAPLVVEKTAEPKKSLLPAAQILPAGGKSLYRSMASVRLLLSKTKAAAVPPSNQQQLQRETDSARTTATAGPSNPRTPTAPSKVSRKEEQARADDDHRPLEDDELPAPSYVPLSTQQMAELMMRSDLDKNKENRPLPPEAGPSAAGVSAQAANPHRRNFIDKQPDAQKVSQINDTDSDSDDSLPPPNKITGKRSRQQFEEPQQADDGFLEVVSDDHDVSEDGGFEDYPRHLPPRLRNPAPEVIRIEGPWKRRKVQSRVISQPSGDRAGPRRPRQPSVNVAALREREVTANRAHHVPAASAGSDQQEEEEEEEEEAPPATYADIQETAQRIKIQQPRKVQPKRVWWSKEETDGLIDLIEREGPAYSLLLKLGGENGVFEDVRDQQSLRDKARNIKVDILIARAMLPKNFDRVILGRKEEDKVRANRANPFRREGEIAGQEDLDEYGQTRTRI